MSVFVERKCDLGITRGEEKKRSAVDVSMYNRRPAGSLRLRVFRKSKVLEVRRELSEGRYAVNEHLNVAFDRLIEDIMMAGDTRAKVPPKQLKRRRFVRNGRG